MTLINLYATQELAMKHRIQEAADKAKLNFSETLALNKKFGLTLEYTPPKDKVEITTFLKRNAKQPEKFVEECFSEALSYGKPIKDEIKIRSKGSFASNLANALKKNETSAIMQATTYLTPKVLISQSYHLLQCRL